MVFSSEPGVKARNRTEIVPSRLETTSWSATKVNIKRQVLLSYAQMKVLHVMTSKGVLMAARDG